MQPSIYKSFSSSLWYCHSVIETAILPLFMSINLVFACAGYCSYLIILRTYVLYVWCKLFALESLCGFHGLINYCKSFPVNFSCGYFGNSGCSPGSGLGLLSYTFQTMQEGFLLSITFNINPLVLPGH